MIGTVDAHKAVVIKTVVLLVMLVSVTEVPRLGDNIANNLHIKMELT